MQRLSNYLLVVLLTVELTAGNVKYNYYTKPLNVCILY